MKNNILITTQKVDKNDSILGFFHSWLVEFAKNYEKVTVVCLHKGEFDLPANVEVLSLGKERGVSKLKYIFNFYKYIFSKRKNYDVVFVHMNPIYVILGGLFWRAMNKKVALWYTHKHVDLKLRLAEKISNIVFTASKESFRLKSNKLQVMGHGIDTSKFSFKDKSGNFNTKFLLLGRISPIKKIEVAIKAMEIIILRDNSYHLDIIGETLGDSDEKYKKYLESLIVDKKLENNIRFIRAVSNDKLLEIFPNYFCLMHTSETGSLDKVVLEAMATGTFVISCNDSISPILANTSLSFTKGDSAGLAKSALLLSSIDDVERTRILNYYREVVVQNHSLEDLIVRIKEKI